MLQAGRQLMTELTSAAEPKTVAEQRGGNRKTGKQQRAKPDKKARGHQASANELGKDRGAGEGRRPGKPDASDLFDSGAPMPPLIDAAIKKDDRKTKPGDWDAIAIMNPCSTVPDPLPDVGKLSFGAARTVASAALESAQTVSRCLRLRAGFTRPIGQQPW
jgi:hypothetical protein